MKHLYVLRSARHRIRSLSNLTDYHRPLIRRGEIAAAAIGRTMRNNNYQPDLVICATPTRTRQTLAQIWPCLIDAKATPPELIFDYRLHLMRGNEVLARLQEVDEKFDSVFMVGITPGVSDLAKLLWKGESGEPNPFEQELPPGNLAIFDCNATSWAQLAPGACTLRQLVR
jgi:phosphohistidine phosphatase